MVSVEDAIAGRQSIRQFLSKPVEMAVVERILETAARAPSGSNIQPWRVWVITGEAKEALSRELLEAHDNGADHNEEYVYYPVTWREPYLSRRRKIGWDMYGMLGITRQDKEAMHHQLGRNYKFFDAPVGLIFTIDRDLPLGSWLDYGIFLGNIMTAARGFGLDTCPQQAFAKYHTIIRRRLGISDDQVVICGMALGWADPDAVVNQLRTERMPLRDFVTFVT
jgi:nitroreductase